MSCELDRYWYRQSLHFFTLVLLPLSWLFAAIVFLRRRLYSAGILKVHKAHVPLIVVGNITVGGTGKTPFVMWLANYLRNRGYKPGIVSRGVGGIKHRKPHQVSLEDQAAFVGDEALLIVKNTQCPMVVAVDRVAAVNHLLANSDCNIIISDDGLQHYRMGRDLQIALVDGMRRMGNRKLLPAGPLREPVSRLREMDFVVVNGGTDRDIHRMSVSIDKFVSVADETKSLGGNEFKNKRVHAMAAIGHPQRFFVSLRNMGLTIDEHSYPDHYLYQVSDFNFQDKLPILMTEKDAMKCAAFADERFWYVRVSVKMNEIFERDLIKSLETKYEVKENTARVTALHDQLGSDSRRS